MKPWQWCMSVAIVLTGVLLWTGLTIWSPRETGVPVEEKHSILPQKAVGPPPPARQTEIKRLYQEPRKVEIPQNNEISAACRAFWNTLMALDLKSLDKLPSPQSCEPPPDLANHQANYLQFCLTKKDTKQCQSALFFYRAYLTEFLTKDSRVDQISDAKVLVDKLFARFLVNPIAAAEVADRMLELYPDYYPAAQAAVLSRLLDLLKGEAKPNPDSPEFNRVLDGIERLGQMNPSDPQNGELELLMKTMDPNNTSQAVRDRLDYLERTSPSMAAYYLAWAEYRDQNADKGWEALSRAHQLAPNDDRINETIKRIKANPTFYKSANQKDREVFTAKFTFNIQTPDLQ